MKISPQLGPRSIGGHIAGILLGLIPLTPALAETGRPDVNTLHGMRVFNRVCSECHYSGKNGAPRLNDISAWRKRLFQGEEVLDHHALEGYLKMPAKGGHPELSDQDVIDAVHYIIIMLRDEPTR